MKPSIAILAAAPSALWMPAVVVDAQADVTAEEPAASPVTFEELASYGLTLAQFESVRRSESPDDFGGLGSQGETDQLWLDAAVFEYEVRVERACRCYRRCLCLRDDGMIATIQIDVGSTGLQQHPTAR